MLTKAVQIATKMHSGQFRKHSRVAIPFIVHPLEVMKTLWSYGVENEEVLIAAVCHDLIEDTEITKNHLEITFGSRVAAIVEELTFNNTMSKADYIASFKNSSVEALAIKVVDRICNIQDFMITDASYAKKYCEKANSLFDALYFRADEITQVFGQKVNAQLCVTHEILMQKLGQMV